jgi:hypothetical protein
MERDRFAGGVDEDSDRCSPVFDRGVATERDAAV